MASEYSVNIRLNTEQVKADLKNLKKDIDKLGRVNIGGGQRAQRTEAKITKNKDAQRAAMVETRRIGDLVQKAADKGLKVDKARNAINRAALADGRQEFKLAKAQHKVALEELKAQKAITKEIAQQAAVRGRAARSIKAGPVSSLTSLGRGTPLGLSGVQAFPQTRDLGMYGPRLPFTGKATGFGRSPVSGRPNQPGSPVASELALQRKLGEMEARSAKFRKAARLERKRSLSLGKDIVRIKTKEVNLDAKNLNRQLLRNAPRESLNFDRQGNLLPGPAGSRQTRAGLSRTLRRNRGPALQSAAISGAFPLLFGQGPVAAAGGALGGGLGGAFGGQMGGFAGGLIGTAVVSNIQGAITEVGKLGAALNDTTKDIAAVSAALGITGTEFEKNLNTLSKLGGEEASFRAARAKMINLVGQEGVTALQNFGKGTTELANQFTIAMTQMKAGFASFLQGTGAGKFLLDRMTTANLIRQSKTSEDSEVVRAREIADAFNTGVIRRSKKERQLVAEGRELGFNTYFDALGGVEEAQKRANKRAEDAAVEKLMADIQKQRVKNISEEITLLEKSMGLSSDEFEIEKQIMQMKQDGEIKDENEIRNKLKHLQNLQKERQLAEETAAAFKEMSKSIVIDIGNGIKDLIKGTATLNDVMTNMLNKMADAFLNLAIFGNMSGNSVTGGLLGMFKADGGPVQGGRSYIVGERGPEVFTPGVSGGITPNHALGGSTNISINVDASGSSVEGDEQQGKELGRMISAAIQSELIKQRRPGGILG